MDSIKLFNITHAKSPLPTCYENFTKNYIFQELNELRLQICPNNDLVNKYNYTLIQLKTGMNDTLKFHFSDNNISLSTNVDSVWYNGILKTYNQNGDISIVK